MYLHSATSLSNCPIIRNTSMSTPHGPCRCLTRPALPSPPPLLPRPRLLPDTSVPLHTPKLWQPIDASVSRMPPRCGPAMQLDLHAAPSDCVDLGPPPPKDKQVGPLESHDAPPPGGLAHLLQQDLVYVGLPPAGVTPVPTICTTKGWVTAPR
jgi:hypothetical protein